MTRGSFSLPSAPLALHPLPVPAYLHTVDTETQHGLSAAGVETISRAIADPRRFAILKQIAACEQGSLCSCLDAQQCLSPATISHHIKELTEAGLIDARREGRNMRLVLRRDTWKAYLASLAAL
jgi:ArsR family transcriptional regulator, arsenate/arsenite/antimonite-responsive transcriptional repressor